MKRFSILFSCLLFATGPALVSAQTVTSDYDSRAEFSNYKTYGWLAPGDTVLNRQRPEKLYDGYITRAANQELKAKGLVLNNQPDAIFVYFTSVDEITTYSQSATLSVGVGVAGPGYYVGGSAPVAGGKITATTEQDGALGFSMYDARTGKLVWTASVKKTFNGADDIPKIINDYTKKIFKKLPVRKK